jgi:hypothetical protein
MARLTAADSRNFHGLGDGIAAMCPIQKGVRRKVGDAFAAHLRQNLGDVDDVVLGRVLLHVGGYVGRLANTPEINALADTILIAAYDMTALERGEIPLS